MYETPKPPDQPQNTEPLGQEQANPTAEEAVLSSLERFTGFVALAASGVSETVKKTGNFVMSESSVAISGLRSIGIERRLERVDRKIEKVERSATIHRAAPARQLIQGRPRLEDDGQEQLQSERDREAMVQYHVTHHPRTKLQQRQAIRAARRIRKNMERAVERRNAELIYNRPDLPTIGTKERKQAIKESHEPWKYRRTALKANHHHHKHGEKIDTKISKVQTSAEGRDIPGRILSARLNRLKRKRGKFQTRRVGQ